MREELVVEVGQQGQAAGVNGTESVGLLVRAERMGNAVGTFGEPAVGLVDQPPVHVAEAILIGHEFQVAAPAEGV